MLCPKTAVSGAVTRATWKSVAWMVVEAGANTVVIRHDARYDRPAEVDLLLGDASKARRVLGWQPKVDFETLVRMMVDADMELADDVQGRSLPCGHYLAEEAPSETAAELLAFLSG